VVTEHSKRPVMAFVSFVRDGGSDAPPHVIAADDSDVA
jgi:hypothetical protein